MELSDGRIEVGPPKSAASRAVVSLPDVVVPVLAEHLAAFTGAEEDALVFTGPRGAPLRRNNFRSLARWGEATAAVGLPGLYFHDLRHTGNTLAASTGASTRELMARMGHDSTRATMIHQHATEQRDRAIAEELNRLIEEGALGTQRARGTADGTKESGEREAESA